MTKSGTAAFGPPDPHLESYMPILRITEKGFEGYTGLLGDIHFRNGVSIENVSRADSRRLASIMGIIEEETGRNPSEAQEMLETRGLTVDEVAEYRSVDPQQPEDFAFTEGSDEIPVSDLIPVQPDYSFTKEDLEKIADEGGIEGLREFAAPYDVRGASIVAIIKMLMAAKTRHEAESKPR